MGLRQFPPSRDALRNIVALDFSVTLRSPLQTRSPGAVHCIDKPKSPNGEWLSRAVPSGIALASLKPIYCQQVKEKTVRDFEAHAGCRVGRGLSVLELAQRLFAWRLTAQTKHQKPHSAK